MSEDESADEADHRKFERGDKTTTVQLLLGCDCTLGQVEAIVIVAISEVVNVVANHGVLAIVHSAHSGPFTSTGEVSLESWGSGVAAR